MAHKPSRPTGRLPTRPMEARSSGHQGALSEMVAIAWFLRNKLEVFRNVSPHGPADIITLNPENGELSLFDVKTSTPFLRKNGSLGATLHRPTDKQRTLGVRILRVFKNGDVGLVPGEESVTSYTLSTGGRDWLILQSCPVLRCLLQGRMNNGP